MCTVTFQARQNGYALGMNRDEKLTRLEALPPARQNINGRTALFPSEPGGGTWVGVNDAGVTFALINWYSVPARVPAGAISRGQIVRAALGFDAAAAVDGLLKVLPLNRTNPFRLIGVLPNEGQVVEWRWNLTRLERVDYDWATNIWISSGFDEPGAERTRRETFKAAVRNQPVQNFQWLRALHASHPPAPGPYSVCMHRADAATVSYTELAVSESTARMSYGAGPPCGNRVWLSRAMELVQPRFGGRVVDDLPRPKGLVRASTVEWRTVAPEGRAPRAPGSNLGVGVKP